MGALDGFFNLRRQDEECERNFWQHRGSNEWAAFFSTYSFVSLAVAENIRNKKISIAAYGLTGLNVLVMLFTFSRGAYAAFVVGLVVYSLLAKKHWWLLLVVLVVAAYSLVLPDSVVERINMSFEGGREEQGLQDQDVASRLAMWNYSLSKILESPLIGNGFMSFVYSEWRNPHNQHLNMLYQGGIIGYFLFVWIFLAAFSDSKNLLSNSINHTLHRAIATGVVSGTGSLFISNMFGDRFTYLPVSGYFWVLSGLVLNLLSDRKIARQRYLYILKKIWRSRFQLKRESTNKSAKK